MTLTTTETTMQDFHNAIESGFQRGIDQALDDQTAVNDAPDRQEIIEAVAYAHEGLEQEPGYDVDQNRIVSQSEDHIVIEIANTRELLADMDDEPREALVDAVGRVFHHTADMDARLENSETYPVGILLREL